MLTVSVIVPTYNERDNIIDLIRVIESNLDSEGWDVELLIVDDNSPDGTADVIAEYQDESSQDIQCIIRRNERGLATAIKHGILNSRGEVIIVMDTDFNHDPKMIPQMVKFLEYYDMVIGSRFVVGGGMEEWHRYYYSLLYNLFVRSLLRLQVQDNLSGFFAIHRAALIGLNKDYIFRGYEEFFIRLLYIARRKRYRILEVPVFYILRRHGQSKSRFLSMLYEYTRCVLGLRFSKRTKLEAAPSPGQQGIKHESVLWEII